MYSMLIFAGHVQLLTWHDCSSRGKTPGRGAGAWRPKALEELEKDFSGLKVMRHVRHFYKLSDLRNPCCSFQSVAVRDSGTFVKPEFSDALREEPAAKSSSVRGHVKFVTSRGANAFGGWGGSEAVPEQKLKIGSNSRSHQSPSLVMEALGKDFIQKFQMNQLEETPDSLNRRGLPGVTRMKHGALVHPTRPPKIRDSHVSSVAFAGSCSAQDSKHENFGEAAKTHGHKLSKAPFSRSGSVRDLGKGLHDRSSDSSSVSSGSTCTRRSPRPSGQKGSRKGNFSPVGGHPPAGIVF
jgi:hypothetical protein